MLVAKVSTQAEHDLTMPHGFGFDHAVILVADLDRAVEDYTELGFTVVPGGEHVDGLTRNALIAFADGSYLELLSFTQRGTWWLLPWLRRLRLLGWYSDRYAGLQRRFLLRAGSGEGLIDFALHSTALDHDLARARSAGVELQGPERGGRTRPDGEEITWQLGIPRTADLPFLCADLSEPGQRAPIGAAREHANGITGVAGVVVAVQNLEASSARYRAMLGKEPRLSSDPTLSTGRARVFSLHNAELTLTAPVGVSALLRRQLRERGEGVYTLRLRSSDAFPTRTLNPVRTHGARLEVISTS